MKIKYFSRLKSLFVMFDSFFLDDEIKNITNPKMSRKLKIDKLKINFFVKIYSSLFFGSFLKKLNFSLYT